MGAIEAHVEPFADALPDARFREGLRQYVVGMLAAGSPQVTKAAAHAPAGEVEPQRFYRLFQTPRVSYRDWEKCLYRDARHTALAADVERVVVAVDPVNFEKAYAEKMEAVCRVRKSTPPGTLPQGEARLTMGYPSIIAQTVNLPQLAIPYAKLFSYTTTDFLSENRELMRALRTLRTVLRGLNVCVVADAGLDDRKLFHYADLCQLEFVIRAATNRWIEVYNDREQRWEDEKLLDLAATFPGRMGFETVFTHAGDAVTVRVTLDWFRMRLPNQSTEYWGIVAHTEKLRPADNAAAQHVDSLPNPLVLITNRPVHHAIQAQQVYQDWRQRPSIEHLNRFTQEDGLDVEKIQLQKLERFRRSFLLILAVAVFVLRLPGLWAPALVHWVRRLASPLADTAQDRGGPYLFLEGIRRILSTHALLQTCVDQPPPVALLSSLPRGPTS